jgi:hypothetical protein
MAHSHERQIARLQSVWLGMFRVGKPTLTAGSATKISVKTATHPASLRIQALLAEAGVPALVVEFDQPTRTSADAALAIGCSVAEIAKSIVFRIKSSGRAVIVVASGDNRVSEQKVEQLIGEPIGESRRRFRTGIHRLCHWRRGATRTSPSGRNPFGQRSQAIQ